MPVKKVCTIPVAKIMTVPRSQLKRLFLGVDGGQTSTTALIGDAAGNVLAQGLGGPSNHVKAAEGRGRLLRAVSFAIATACLELHRSKDSTEFQAACLGFTGGIEDKEEVLREVVRCRRMLVTDDVTIALAGAHQDGTGIVTIAGTGSVAMGRNAAGDIAKVGGWGYAFGDEGSAWGIVREALRAAFRWKEGWGPPTLLHDLFLQDAGISDIHVFRRRLYTEEYPRPRIAAFSKLVDDAARQGDAVALDILRNAAESLSSITDVVHRRVFAPSDCVDVAYVGGVFSSNLVLDEFRRTVECEGRLRVVQPRYSPTMGALREAIRLGQAA
jgi:N-acetylglucosamine kinase-like BadF-type ATPase